MQIPFLFRKDNEHINSLLLSMDFLSIRKFLIDKNVYTPENRSLLLLETLLMGDYQSAIDLIEEGKISIADYSAVAEFGDAKVFDFMMFALEDDKRPQLSLALVMNFKKSLDCFEKCDVVLSLKSIDLTVLKALCLRGKDEVLKYFISYFETHQNDKVYSSFFSSLVKMAISTKNIFLLQIVLENRKLDDDEIFLLDQDQFAWYVGYKYVNNSLIEAVIDKVDCYKFKCIIRVRNLNYKQTKKLFNKKKFNLFCIFVAHSSLPETFEKRLYRGNNGKYLAEYLKYHNIGIWKYLRYNLPSCFKYHSIRVGNKIKTLLS